MKKISLIFFILILVMSCEAKNFDEIFSSTQPADFSLLKNVDPYQQEDYHDYAWTPYPLFRTCSNLYTQTGVIEAGYYLLVPREMKGRKYVFFKENGIVKHVVPVHKTEAVEAFFYENIMPQPKKNKWQKFTEGTAKKFHKTFKGSRKQAPPNAFIVTNHQDANYSEIILYYENTKYFMLFKMKRN